MLLCKIAKFSDADDYFKLALKDLDYPNLVNIYNNAAKCAKKANNDIQAKQYTAAAVRHSLLKGTR